MSWIKNTGSKYHTQDTSYYCGAASAMMVLAEIGIPYSSLDQDDLYAENHSHNQQSGWATDPVGLAHTLMLKKPANHNRFDPYLMTSEAEGTRKIVYTLQKFGVSPVALVYGCAHWIVVVGVQTNVNPATGPYTVEGFWVNNPVHEDNEVHSGGDICGTGGTHGIENQWVSYNSWQNLYFTGCAYNSADGSKQYISVCDPESPRIELPSRIKRIKYFEGFRIAPETELHNVLKKEIDRTALLKTKEFERFNYGAFEKPLLVRRMDKPNSHYYLLPNIENDKIIGYAQLDAYSGELDSLYSLRNKIDIYDTDHSLIAEKLHNIKVELRRSKGRIRLDAKKIRISSALVWRPCQESFSPHLPFWRIRVGNTTLYKRIDGPIFSQLTLNGKGI